MSNKAAEKREFRTSDLLLLVVLVGAVGTIVGAMLAQVLHSERPHANHSAAVVEGPVRLPASVAIPSSESR